MKEGKMEKKKKGKERSFERYNHKLFGEIFK
jgi:hypothetical protein